MKTLQPSLVDSAWRSRWVAGLLGWSKSPCKSVPFHVAILERQIFQASFARIQNSETWWNLLLSFKVLIKFSHKEEKQAYSNSFKGEINFGVLKYKASILRRSKVDEIQDFWNFRQTPSFEVHRNFKTLSNYFPSPTQPNLIRSQTDQPRGLQKSFCQFLVFSDFDKSRAHGAAFELVPSRRPAQRRASRRANFGRNFAEKRSCCFSWLGMNPIETKYRSFNTPGSVTLSFRVIGYS